MSGREVDSRPAAVNEFSLPEEYKSVLGLRRAGMTYDEIADRLGYENRFEVIDILNRIYKRVKPINVEEVRDSIESQITDLVGVYTPPAMDGNIKAASFVLKALELHAKLRGAIKPPEVNIEINNQKPWERVFAATLTNVDEDGKMIVEGEVINYDETYGENGQGK